MKTVMDVRRNKKRGGIIKYLRGIKQVRKGELKDIFALSDFELNLHLGMLKKGNLVDIGEDVVMITEKGEYLAEILKERSG